MSTRKPGWTDVWLRASPSGGWGWTLLSGFHGARHQDLDGDGGADLPAFRPRRRPAAVRYERGRHGRSSSPEGSIAENRAGGTFQAPSPRTAARSRRHRHATRRRRSDRAMAGWRPRRHRPRLISPQRAARGFGDVVEQGVRHTAFGEATIAVAKGRHTIVAGAALQQDRFASRDLDRFDYRYTVPAIFAQDQVTFGGRAALSASARVDVHSRYGTLVSPRVAPRQAPPGWTGALDRRGACRRRSPRRPTRGPRASLRDGIVADARDGIRDLTGRRARVRIAPPSSVDRGRSVQLAALVHLSRR